MAFKMKGKIVKINKEQRYSLKLSKIFNVYTVQITTENEIVMRSMLYQLKKDLKNAQDIETKLDIEDRIQDLTNAINDITIPKLETFKQIDILLYLADKYKEVVDNG